MRDPETADSLGAMTSARVRTLCSLGLLGCATAVLVPLGCGATIRDRAASERPRVPGATAERLRECVDEYGGDLPGGHYTFDVAVKADEEGRVVDVEARGVPHADLAGCTRLAFRAMTVPEYLLRVEKFRLPAPPTPASGQVEAERELVGHAGALVAVAVALAELVIQVGPTVIAIAAAVEVTGEIAETARKRKKKDPCQEPLNDCLDSARQGKDGGKWRHSLCMDCLAKCRGEGKWPDGVMLNKWESCK